MQLPPDEELVLVSGLAPIRARKLRYFSDRNFTNRKLAPPRLGEGAYRDRPAVRPDDWPRDARSIDPRLASPTHESSHADDGGLQQERHPGLPQPRDPSPERGGIDPNADVSEDTALAPDQHAMTQARGPTPPCRAHGP